MPAVVAPGLSPAGATLPAGAPLPAGATLPTGGCGGSQFLLNHGRDNPTTTSLVVEIPETSENLTQSSLFTNGSFMEACVIVACYVT